MKYRFVIVFVAGLAGAAWADEVKLRSGGTLKGTAREENGKVVLDTGFGTVTLEADQVEAVTPEPLQPCQEPTLDVESSPQVAVPPVRPPEPKTPRAQQKVAVATLKPITHQRSHAQPEISPGYAYFGIPPSVPARGSGKHGYGGYSFPAVPTPVRGLYITP